MKIYKLLLPHVLVALAATTYAQDTSPKLQVDRELNYCTQQALKVLKEIPQNGKLPRMIVGQAREWKMVPYGDWTSGFWPGILWYLYEATNDVQWKSEADKYTRYLTPLSQKPAFDHDLGFQIFCSFGNGYRLTKEDSYRQVINRTSDTLATLYDPKIGTILSWPFRFSELGGHNTIIDNMMNLEMLMWSARNTNNKNLAKIAIKHAEATMKNHFRSDFSSYHV
ncbi:MAG: glucuronyl hydrolase, partial [Pedobacter sp.]